MGLTEVELHNVVHYHSQLEVVQAGQTVETEVEDPELGPGGVQQVSQSHQLELSQLGVLQSSLAQLGNCSVTPRQLTRDRLSMGTTI